MIKQWSDMTPEEQEEINKKAEEMLQAQEYKPKFKEYIQWKEIQIGRNLLEEDCDPCQTGIFELDQNCKIFGKKLVTICARSEYGKSSFMAHMIRIQLLQGKRVLVFSCEEAGEDFIDRIEKSDDIQQKMFKNFLMSDDENITLRDIKLTCLKLDLIGTPPDIVYVDQLNKIKPEEKFRGTKHEKIVSISERLQGVVKAINRPLVILHQANRAAEQNDGFMTQANMSDADAVFSEGQIVFFLESKDFFEWNKTKTPYREKFEYFINVGKNRSKGGWKGAVRVVFDRSTGSFYSENQYESEKFIRKL